MAYYFNGTIQTPNGIGISLNSTNNNNVIIKPPVDLNNSYSLILPSANIYNIPNNSYLTLTDNITGQLEFNTFINSNSIISSNDDIEFISIDGNVDIGFGDDSELSILNGETEIVKLDTNNITLNNDTIINGNLSINNLNIIQNSGNVEIYNNLSNNDIIFSYFKDDIKYDSFKIDSSNEAILIVDNNKLAFNNINTNIFSPSEGDLSINSNNLILNTLTNIEEGMNISGNITLNIDVISNITNGYNILTNTNCVKSINIDTTSNITYSIDSNESNINNGQLLYLFYNNANSIGQAAIDFGENKLFSGSGMARYMTFYQTGQSAQLLFMNSNVAGNSGWRIINTGAKIT